MARQLRIEYPGALYHVTSRGNERRPIFRSVQDRLAFLVFLGLAVRRFKWSVTAWVLMTNHFHLVIQTPEPNAVLALDTRISKPDSDTRGHLCLEHLRASARDLGRTMRKL